MILKKYATMCLGLTLSIVVLSGCSEKPVEIIGGNPALNSQQVSRGEIAKIINATGNVRPEITVEVGSEVSGRILSVNVDFNSSVKQGDILAEIDPENLKNRVAQNIAQVENRQSDITIQKAALKRAEVNAAQAERSLNRRQQLYQENAISQAQLEETERTMNLANADIELAEARLAGARSSLKQAEANLRVTKVDLSRALIRAPIDGVVIERLVDPGQTVAASFSAPKLFIIAGDLSKIKVDAAIVEGDISGLDAGDRATFGVDAYPGRVFVGEIEQLRLKSEAKNNIVTYTAVIVANNSDRVLMPGMTANLQITTNSKKDILRIPSSAERFRPTPDQIKTWEVEGKDIDDKQDADPKARQRLITIGIDDARVNMILNRMSKETKELRKQIADPTQNWRRVARMKSLRDITERIIKDDLNSKEYQNYRLQVQAAAKIRDAEIWVKDGEKMHKITVGLGLSDGSFTEVINGIEKGEAVITGISGTQPGLSKRTARK
jgi:HlyD family secretion protein